MLEKKGQFHQGHRHNFDHITNLIKGSVLLEMDGAEQTVYNAVAMIGISKDRWHKFTALEDEVIYQCIFKMVDKDDLNGLKNFPYGHAPFNEEELRVRMAALEDPCGDCKNCGE
jgi:hypothetical protein